MSRILGGLLAVALCGTLGCGGTNAVTGKVRLDGQPLTKGTVTFNPKGGAAAAATGTIDSSGNYRLSVGTSPSVAPGEYQVTIQAVEIVPPTPTDPSPLPKKLLPEKYSDPANPEMLRVVKPGANSFDFDLKSM